MSQQPAITRLNRLRAILYGALVFSAGVAFFGIEAIQARVLSGQLEPEWRLVPSIVFGVTLVLYAADRVLLVRSGRYPSGRAFFQVAFGLALLTFLLPGGLRDYRNVRAQVVAPDAVVALMRHPDARVRAVAAEVAGYRSEGPHLKGLVELLTDPDPAVREAALAALERRTGRSMGPAGTAAHESWRQYVDSLPDPRPTPQEPTAP